MVGRPNFPPDVDRRDDLKGSAAGTPGLTALDEEREASLADEGGSAGAVVETQDEEERKRLSESLPVSHLVVCNERDDERGRAILWTVGGLLAGAVLGLLVLRRFY